MLSVVLLCVISIKYVTFVGKLWMLRKLQSEDKECPWSEKRKNTVDGACFFSGWRFRENHQYQIYLSYENCKFRHNALSGELLYGATPRR